MATLTQVGVCALPRCPLDDSSSSSHAGEPEIETLAGHLLSTITGIKQTNKQLLYLKIYFLTVNYLFILTYLIYLHMI